MLWIKVTISDYYMLLFFFLLSRWILMCIKVKFVLCYYLRKFSLLLQFFLNFCLWKTLHKSRVYWENKHVTRHSFYCKLRLHPFSHVISSLITWKFVSYDFNHTQIQNRCLKNERKHCIRFFTFKNQLLGGKVAFLVQLQSSVWRCNELKIVSSYKTNYKETFKIT